MEGPDLDCRCMGRDHHCRCESPADGEDGLCSGCRDEFGPGTCCEDDDDPSWVAVRKKLDEMWRG